MSGTLILCATPIGNLGDAPPRLAEALASAAVVYAEDTRHTRKLTGHLGVDTPLRSFFAGNESERAAEIEERLRNGDTVAVVTDAGTPAVSDPGYLAVQAAVSAGATVTVIPGPSAVTAALAVAGLASERFTFEGFLPRKGAPRRQRLEAIAARSEATVLFVSPHRAGADISELAQAVGDRQIVVARELTKMHEEVWRGTAAEAAQQFGAGRGEFTIVVEGAALPAPDLDAAVAAVSGRVEAGESLRDAVRAVADEAGLSRRTLYEAALRVR